MSAQDRRIDLPTTAKVAALKAEQVRKRDRVKQAELIVRQIAADWRPPLYWSEAGGCACCGYCHTRTPAVLTDHIPLCVYRLAREWVEAE